MEKFRVCALVALGVALIAVGYEMNVTDHEVLGMFSSKGVAVLGYLVLVVAACRFIDTRTREVG